MALRPNVAMPVWCEAGEHWVARGDACPVQRMTCKEHCRHPEHR
jgi:hypothetical protein